MGLTARRYDNNFKPNCQEHVMHKENNMKKNVNTSWIAALFVLTSGTSLAGSVGPLTTFSAGTTAQASQVNGNFSAVSTAVNDNNARINMLQTVVTAGGNIGLANSTEFTGNILKGVSPFLHNYGTDNTFLGIYAGNFRMTGANNTAIGTGALGDNTTGYSNTASGRGALLSNTTGSNNTANGFGALQSNTGGYQNTAIGVSALQNNTSANNATAIGAFALQQNTTGYSNTGSGVNALFSNTIGYENTAVGVNALQGNIAGAINTAVGMSALANNTTGGANVAIGWSAGSSLTTGSNNVAIGSYTYGVAGESNTIRIGGNVAGMRTFIAGITGVGVTGSAVYVSTGGQLGILSSSQRFKDNIADMAETSSVLKQLRPVTFHYKTDQNPKGRSLQYGLIAEEVAKVAPGLVAHSANGEIETVFYQHLTPMLLNEYQKQQRTIDTQTAALAKQTERVAELEQERRLQTARIETLEKQAAHLAVVLGRLERAGMLNTAGR
jgi:hypothetical protein